MCITWPALAVNVDTRLVAAPSVGDCTSQLAQPRRRWREGRGLGVGADRWSDLTEVEHQEERVVEGLLDVSEGDAFAADDGLALPQIAVQVCGRDASKRISTSAMSVRSRGSP